AMTATRSARFSKAASGATACIIAILAILYLCAVYWSYRLLLRAPRPLNKSIGVKLQRYAPGESSHRVAYGFLVFSSLAELGVSSWLLSQYRFNNNAPNDTIVTGLGLLIFCSCWTAITGAVFTVLFIHPVWSTTPWASLGVQGLWVITTWAFWVAGAAITNTSFPALFSRGICYGLVYCKHIQTLFGEWLSIYVPSNLVDSFVALSVLEL
ncbi:hypothetical protein PLEOSDRAFT_1046404, partial [Pleurotus ostreatus PC15]